MRIISNHHFIKIKHNAMKKIIYFIILVSFLSLPVYSQSQNGNGNIIQKEVALNTISKIINLTSANIYITNSYSDKLILEIDENLVNYIKYETHGNNIEIKSNAKSIRPTKFNLYLNVSKLEEIENTGSGEISTTNTIKSENFSLNNTGSGNCNIKVSSKVFKSEVTGSGNASIDSDADICDIEHTGSGDIKLRNINTNSSIDFENTGSGKSDINLNCKNLELNLNGSGDAIIAGYSKDFNLHILGSGNLAGENFNVDNCDVKLSGSGDAEFHCKNTAEIKIMGSGDLKLSGNYKINKISTLGSGRLIK